MDVNSINNNSVYGSQYNNERQKSTKDIDTSNVSNKQPVDKLELSEEAKLAKLLDSQSIQDKIKSGFYDNPEVLNDVALKLTKELAFDTKK